LRADCLLGVVRQLRQEGRHAASTEVEEPRPYRLDGDTSIVIATFGRDDSAFTLGAVAAVQTTIWFPFQ
jgi:hypothetical protein